MKHQFPCPMKVWSASDKAEVEAAILGDEYSAQRKLDGASYVLVKDDDGVAHLYSGSISRKDGKPIDKIDNVPHIKKFIESFFRNSSSLVAELYSYVDYSTGSEHTREMSAYTNTIMLCNAAKAIARQNEYGPIRCYVFDILEWNNKDVAAMPFEERDKILNNVFEFFPRESWLSKAETYNEDKDVLLQQVLANGGEGIVLKRKNAPHPVVEIGCTPKRPAHATIKVKEINTIDAVIMGVTFPEKEYKGKDPENYPYRDEDGNPVNRLWALGMANALVLGVYKDGELIEIGTCASGLDDSLRAQLGEDPASFRGDVVEIECMSLDRENGTLRHPRFIKFRNDKPVEQCDWESVFG